MPKYRFSLVANARWEEETIQEWVEYHKSVGIDHIYLYSNDDDPAALFRAVAPYVFGPDPFITFRHWRPNQHQQVPIYLHWLETFRHETEWFSFLDIDEFLVFKNVDNIATFMRDYEASVDCLYLHWLIYGHSGKLKREPVPTLTTYLRRAARLDGHTKMICRSSIMEPEAIRTGYYSGRGAFFHFLDFYNLPNVRCADVLLTPMDGYSDDFLGGSAEPFINRPGFQEAALQRGYVAHFQFRSEDDFMRRWRRGGRAADERWRKMFENGTYRYILEQNNAVYDSYLAEYWYRYTKNALDFGLEPPFGAPPHKNVGLNKPAFQSSVYAPTTPEPRGSRVSGSGNNGLRTGTYGFHTKRQEQPWWCVDLLGPHRIAEIHIYNRIDSLTVALRTRALEVMGSLDTEDWTTIYTRTAAEPFGLDGTPLVIRCPPETPFRFVMVRLPGTEYLHLDEVEIYGEPV